MFKSAKFTVIIAAVAVTALCVSCGKKTKARKEAQTASERGFHTITTPVTELEKIKKDLENKHIPAGIGIGESTDEQVARSVSSDQARSDVATSIDALVQRLSESYAQNVNSEAKKIWEEGIRQITNQHIVGSHTIKTVVQYNKDEGKYNIYTLLAVDPTIFKDAISQATAREEELELRVKKDELMKKMDEAIQTYDDKYRGQSH